MFSGGLALEPTLACRPLNFLTVLRNNFAYCQLLFFYWQTAHIYKALLKYTNMGITYLVKHFYAMLKFNI